jgi:WD40 repeat protein
MRHVFRFGFPLVVFVASLFAADPEPPRLVLPTAHGGAATLLAVLPDERFVVSGTMGGQIKLWDINTGTELNTLSLSVGKDEGLMALHVRNATQIYAVRTHQVTLIEIPSMKILNTIESKAAIVSSTVSVDGESLWVGGANDEKQFIHVLRRGRVPFRQVMERTRPAGAARGWGVPGVSNDGRHAIITEAYKSPTVLVRTEDGQIVHTMSEGTKQSDGASYSSSTWSSDGRIIHTRSLGTSNFKNVIEFINPDSLQVEWSTELSVDSQYSYYTPRSWKGPADATVFTSGKKFFVLEGTRVDGPYQAPEVSLYTAAVVNARTVLFTTHEGNYFGVHSNQLRKFDRARGSFSEPWSPPVYQTNLLVGSSRGDALFVTNRVKDGKLLQLGRGGLRIIDVPLPGCFDAVFSPNGQEVIFHHGDHDKRISGVIDVDNPGQPRIAKMPFETTGRGINGNTVLSPSGKLMVDIRAGSSSVQVYDPYSGRVLHAFPNGYYSYDLTSGSAAFSPDDRRIIFFTSEKDQRGRSVVCYDLTTGQKLWARGQFYTDFVTFRFSDDGKEVHGMTNGRYPRLYTFNAETGETIREHKLPVDELSSHVIFNPAGTEAALPVGDSIVFVSIADGKELRRCTYPSQLAERLTYLGNNRIASTGADNAIRFWDTLSGEMLGTVSFSRDGREWAFIHPSGRFEATQGFQEQMYFVQNATKVPLTAYFEAYHSPGLIGQIMAGDPIAAPTIELKDLTEPPKVRMELFGSTRNLTVEDAPQEVSTGQATLRILAQSAESKVAEIRLYHNDKLVESRTRNLSVEDDDATSDVDLGKGGRTETITVSLLPGENTFRAVALNEQRTESAPAQLALDYNAPQAALAGRDGGGVQLHLLVIGVNTYRNPKYNLNYAVPDATAVRDLVQKNSGGIFSKVNVTTFFNEKATRSAILESFTTIAKQSGPRDVFVFYFAGHGVMSSDSKSEFFLAPHELTQLYGADDQLRVKAISSAELLTASQKISAQKQLFLLDACQSAGALQTVAARGASEEKAVAQLARASGTHWITASGSEQFATEFEKLGHGTFTYALLEALSGKADNGDGRVSVNEIKAYLETQVPELTKTHKGTPQYPASYGFGQDFPLSIISKN